jgi:hypothetical protein
MEYCFQCAIHYSITPFYLLAIERGLKVGTTFLLNSVKIARNNKNPVAVNRHGLSRRGPNALYADLFDGFCHNAGLFRLGNNLGDFCSSRG